jgi:porin
MKRLPILLALLAALAAGAARAEDAAPVQSVARPAAQAATAPAAAEESATTVRLQYTGEAASNFAGGLRNGLSYTNSIDADLAVDTARAFGWTGGSFRLEGFYTNGTSLERSYVGALQDPSTIDTGQGALVRLYQLYYEQRLGGTDIVAGIFDLQRDFGATKPMDVFLNGAYAWNSVLDMSGRNGASTYPNTALGLRLRQRIDNEWSVKLAVMNGVPDSIRNPSSNAITFSKTNGAFFIGQVDYQPTRTTKLIGGGWTYTSKFTALDRTDYPVPVNYGSTGAYIGGATRLLSQGGARGIDAFATLGIGIGVANLLSNSLNFGATWTGPIAARPHDRLGLGIGIAGENQTLHEYYQYVGINSVHHEENIELTYRAPLNDWLVMQPDLQYFHDAAFDPRRKDDWLFILHFELGHVFGL